MTPADKDRPDLLVIEIVGDSARFNGQPLTPEQLRGIAERFIGDDLTRPRRYLLRASKDQKLADVLRVAEALQAGGARVIRFETIDPEK